MTLGEKQRMFSLLFVALVCKANGLDGLADEIAAAARALGSGCKAAIGEIERHKQAADWLAKAGLGTRNSLHLIRLAGDLHLFADTDGDGDLDYLTDTVSHRALGEWWEKQHELCRWGGRFGRADGNHYSLAHDGRA